MYRIYFDGNEGPDEPANRYGLWLDKSKKDLANIPGGPVEGMLVTIYMVAEMEMEATLEWNAKWNDWTAKPVEGTIRDNHETWDDVEHRKPPHPTSPPSGGEEPES
jgi:hypothetical protein